MRCRGTGTLEEEERKWSPGKLPEAETPRLPDERAVGRQARAGVRDTVLPERAVIGFPGARRGTASRTKAPKPKQHQPV